MSGFGRFYPDDINEIHVDEVYMEIYGKRATLLYRRPWDIDQLAYDDEFLKIWRELSFGHERLDNLKVGEAFCDLLHLWKEVAVPAGLVGIVPLTPRLFARASKAYDTEIINLVLDHPDVFEAVKTYCIDKGLDSMIDAYFGGVPIDDIIA